jgi:hypothetical protein
MPYPSSDLDVPDRLIGVLGNFWSDIYVGSLPVASVVSARGRLSRQGANDVSELLAACGRKDVPVYHVQQWYALQLLASAKINTATWQLPDDIADTRVITNRLTNPSLTLVRGLDYTIQNKQITFTADPFQNSLVSTKSIYTNGVATDTECTLWAYMAAHDRSLVYNQYGYAIGLQFPSSAYYHSLVNAYYAAMIDGGTELSTNEVCALAADVPLVLSDGETVEFIINDSRYQWVLTDQNAYRLNLSATPTVKVGDVLSVGQPISTTFTIFPLTNAVVPSPADVPFLTLGPGLLANGYAGGITFENAVVPTVVDEHDPSNYTKISWSLGGVSLDVTKFWNDTHTAGVAAGQTLAMLMDLRAKPLPSQPTAVTLPTTVNPLAFLIQNVLRNNACIIRLQQATFGPNALGVSWLESALRQLIPAYSTAILLLV